MLSHLGAYRKHATISRRGILNFCRLLCAGVPVSQDMTGLFVDKVGAVKPFASHYQEHVLPHVQTFEQDRLKALADLRSRSLVALPAILLVVLLAGWLIVALANHLKGDTLELILFLSAAAIGGLWLWASAPQRKYHSSVKGIVFPAIFNFFGPWFKYSESGLMPISSLESSKIIPDYDDAMTEDYVHGEYHGVNIELEEARLTKIVKRSRYRTHKTVFKGVFVRFSMNKNFKGRTLVKRDGGIIGNWFAGVPSNMQRVALEDPEFEDKFEVFSTDQVEARYLLTTSFMERLLTLTQLFGGKNLQCSFYENQLLVMISSDLDRFEASSIFKPATFVEDAHMVLAQMQEIFEIIETLKLHQHTGL